MILVVGGTGRMGSHLVRRLISRGEKVRVLSRNPGAVAPDGVEVVPGDISNPGSLGHALEGVRTVVAAAHGFDGRGRVNPTTIDWQGNRSLIQAAESAGVEHFILLSVLGAAIDHPMDLFQMKARAERALRDSSLGWTIVRATAFMETWMTVVGEPLVRTGKTRIFGTGQNPINFVSASDVAEVVATAVFDPLLRKQVVEVVGPEDLSFVDFTRIIQEVVGRPGKVARVPRAALRTMSVVMTPVNPTLTRQARAALVMDSRDMSVKATADPGAVRRVGSLRLADVVRRDQVEAPAAEPASREDLSGSIT